MSDDDTPFEGLPKRIVAGNFVSGAERGRLDRHDAKIERWKTEAREGGGSRADRIRLAAVVGCCGLLAGLLYVPCFGIDEKELKFEIVWRWIWEAGGLIDGTRLGIQMAIIAAVGAVAVLVASRDPS